LGYGLELPSGTRSDYEKRTIFVFVLKTIDLMSIAFIVCLTFENLKITLSNSTMHTRAEVRKSIQPLAAINLGNRYLYTREFDKSTRVGS